MKLKKINPDYFRNVIFGAEDSLVSTVGILYGVSTASHSKTTVLITGLIVVVVAGLSMGAGAYLTETTTHKIDTRKHTDKPWVDGVTMFLSYFFAGLIPLAPYLLFDVDLAKNISVAIGVIALFFLGLIPTKDLREGLRMTVVAGFAILVGFIIGNTFKLE
jgi:VIT1/CCC1 family predicted Fe2+/Mn2+ transporter